MSLVNNLQHSYRRANAAVRLIYINMIVYLGIQVFLILMKLFTLNGEIIMPYLALPSDPGMLLFRPWTLITYMFLHQDFFHILFNMVALYWFGKLFLMYFNGKQLMTLYLFGGIIGGLVYIFSFNFFPLFEQLSDMSILMGASGSIMAIIVATALYSPDMEMRMLLLGTVKLKYIALAVVLISFFGITSSNAGGEIAHLGGALFGYFFIVSLRRGKDTTRGFSKLLDSISNLFKPRRLKVKKPASGRKMTDEEYNMNKARDMVEIDRILDKIKASGYGSLTAAEKQKLFEQGK